MITRTPNDFMYYDSPSWGPDTINFAGGRFKVPVWLGWATWGLVVGIILIIETVMGIVSGALMVGPCWPLTGIIVGLSVLVLGIYWALYGLYLIIRAWVRVIRGGL